MPKITYLGDSDLQEKKNLLEKLYLKPPTSKVSKKINRLELEINEKIKYLEEKYPIASWEKEFHDRLGIDFARNCDVFVGFDPRIFGKTDDIREKELDALGEYLYYYDNLYLNPNIGAGNSANGKQTFFHEKAHSMIGKSMMGMSYRTMEKPAKGLSYTRSLEKFHDVIEKMEEADRNLNICMIDEAFANASEEYYLKTVNKFVAENLGFNKKNYKKARDIFYNLFKTNSLQRTAQIAIEVINDSYEIQKNALVILENKINYLKNNNPDYSLLLWLSKK
jgi:hypothetical protein